MSYITPNSTIQLYKNMLIDTQYNDTLYFDSPASQEAWFSSTDKLVQTLGAMSYVRKGKLKVRYTPNNWSETYQINYMRFKNTSFENKWFYCFVTNIDYINNNTAEISFVIDVMQTWFIGANAQNNLLQSYVIREHSPTDAIGENIEPEPVQTNEYVEDRDERQQIGFSSIGYIVMLVNTENWSSGKLLGQVYSGATAYYFSQTDIDGIDNLLDQYIQAPDSVLAIYCIPSLEGTTVSGAQLVSRRGYWENVEANAIKVGDELDGYVPKNNKCYTYPYTFLRTFTFEGNYADFRYEFFNDSPEFAIVSTIVQPVKAVCYPRDYKGADDSEVATEGLSISSFPLCSWNNDTYAAWFAQNSVPMNNLTKAQESKISLNTEQAQYNNRMETWKTLADLTAGAIDTYIGLGFLSPEKGMSQAFDRYVSNKQNLYNTDVSNQKSNIDFNTSMQNSIYSASIQADTIHGSIASGSVSIALDRPGFYATRITQKAQVMKRIDDYFSLYGYNYNKIEVPNISSRPHWNFARVSDIQFNVSIPADALTAIKQIFENGIRFWKSADEIGDYSLDNSPSA